MKANRKFLNEDDDAVSPVIAVILMVAITVVLAATVYVWVSGFSTGNSSTRSIALSSGGPITDSGVNKTYVVASASPGLKWNELDFSIDGTALAYSNADATLANEYCVYDSGGGCTKTTEPTDTITAGDRVSVFASSVSGKTLRVIDANSNAVIATLVVT